MKTGEKNSRKEKDELIEKLDNIIQQSRSENIALRKILIRLEKLSENPDENIKKLKKQK